MGRPLILALLLAPLAGCQQGGSTWIMAEGGATAPLSAFPSPPSPVCAVLIPGVPLTEELLARGGELRVGVGSACVVSPTTLVLSAHQVDAPEGQICVDGFWTLYSVRPGSRPDNELVEIELRDPLPRLYPTATIDFERPVPVGTPVVVSAVLKDAELLMTGEGTAEAVSFRGTVAPFYSGEFPRGLLLKTETDAGIKSGMSGAPALAHTNDGWVVVGVAARRLLGRNGGHLDLIAR